MPLSNLFFLMKIFVQRFQFQWSLFPMINNMPIFDHIMDWGRTWWRHQMETFSALLAICAGNSYKGQWCGALMFSLICVWINGLVNNRETGDLRRYRARYDVTVMEEATAHYSNQYWSGLLTHMYVTRPRRVIGLGPFWQNPREHVKTRIPIPRTPEHDVALWAYTQKNDRVLGFIASTGYNEY